MGTVDPFDLVKRLSHAPLGPLVDALRRVHDQGSGESDALAALLAGRGGSATVPTPAPPLVPGSPNYEAARQHFVRHSERLREQAILAEKLLDGLIRHASSATPGILQQELRIRCGPGTAARARFVVVNCLDRAVDVLFRTGHVHGVSADVSASVLVAFDPERPRLEPGEERDVQIVVDLPLGAGLSDPLELGVDVLGGDQLMHKLWVRIELGGGAV